MKTASPKPLHPFAKQMLDALDFSGTDTAFPMAAFEQYAERLAEPDLKKQVGLFFDCILVAKQLLDRGLSKAGLQFLVLSGIGISSEALIAAARESGIPDRQLDAMRKERAALADKRLGGLAPNAKGGKPSGVGVRGKRR